MASESEYIRLTQMTRARCIGDLLNGAWTDRKYIKSEELVEVRKIVNTWIERCEDDAKT